MVVDLDSDGIPRVKVLECMACASIFSGDPSAKSIPSMISPIVANLKTPPKLISFN